MPSLASSPGLLNIPCLVTRAAWRLFLKYIWSMNVTPTPRFYGKVVETWEQNEKLIKYIQKSGIKALIDIYPAWNSHKRESSVRSRDKIVSTSSFLTLNSTQFLSHSHFHFNVSIKHLNLSSTKYHFCSVDTGHHSENSCAVCTAGCLLLESNSGLWLVERTLELIG